MPAQHCPHGAKTAVTVLVRSCIHPPGIHHGQDARFSTSTDQVGVIVITAHGEVTTEITSAIVQGIDIGGIPGRSSQLVVGRPSHSNVSSRSGQLKASGPVVSSMTRVVLAGGLIAALVRNRIGHCDGAGCHIPG